MRRISPLFLAFFFILGAAVPVVHAQDASEEEMAELEKELLDDLGVEGALEHAAEGQAIINNARSKNFKSAPVTMTQRERELTLSQLAMAARYPTSACS